MKLPSRKRPEQSGYTFALAALYSFFLHAAIVAVALFWHFLVVPRVVLPPAYQVKLVGQPRESVPKPAAAPASPKKEAMPEKAKPSPKVKKAAVEVKKEAPKKASLPDLTRQKKTPAPVEQTKPTVATAQKPPASPAVPVEAPAAAEKKSEGVGVTPQPDFKYSWYIDTVSEKIRQNWNPPPDNRDAKARIIFKINRSGWVIASHLDEEHSNGSFTFKQAAYRAISASNPFPALPEESFQQSLEFTVDLIPED
jgi:outer membrane biosynthesis protein TonB